MIARRYRIVLWLAALVAFGWLVIALLSPNSFPRGLETIGIGLFMGTLFGQPTLAGAWTALGRAPLVWRLPLSLIWLLIFDIAVAINVDIPNDDAVVVVGGLLFGQWLLVQVPLWGMVLRYGLRLRHVDEADLAPDPRDRQFGLRQLLVITAIVGAIFGVGRIAVTQLGFEPQLRDVLILAFLAVAEIVIALPLLLAALLRRRAIPASLMAMVLICLATACELPLLRSIQSRGGPTAGDLISINAFTVAWTLAFVVVIRLGGYRLATSAVKSVTSQS